MRKIKPRAQVTHQVLTTAGTLEAVDEGAREAAAQPLAGQPQDAGLVPQPGDSTAAARLQVGVGAAQRVGVHRLDTQQSAQHGSSTGTDPD